MYSAPDEHIEFMHMHRETCRDYFEGKPPQILPPEPSFLARLFGIKEDKGPEPIAAPHGWPTSPPDFLDMGIDHENLGLYERILHKDQNWDDIPKSVAIFHPYITGEETGVPLDHSREAFAYWYRQLHELLLLVKSVTHESVHAVYRDWNAADGDDNEPDMDFAEELHSEFAKLAEFLTSAIARKQGLVVVSS